MNKIKGLIFDNGEVIEFKDEIYKDWQGFKKKMKFKTYNETLMFLLDIFYSLNFLEKDFISKKIKEGKYARL